MKIDIYSEIRFWNPDFLNSQFLEPLENSEQKLFSLDRRTLKFYPKFLKLRHFIDPIFIFCWRFEKSGLYCSLFTLVITLITWATLPLQHQLNTGGSDSLEISFCAFQAAAGKEWPSAWSQRWMIPLWTWDETNWRELLPVLK